MQNGLIDKRTEIKEICKKSKKSKKCFIYDSDNNKVTLNSNDTKVSF